MNWIDEHGFKRNGDDYIVPASTLWKMYREHLFYKWGLIILAWTGVIASVFRYLATGGFLP